MLAAGQTPRQSALTGLLKPRDTDRVYRWLREWRQDKAVRVRPPC